MTAQISDRLIFEGIEMPLMSIVRLPEAHPRINQKSIEQAMDEFFWAGSSACWRNYMATWKVRDSSLYLIDLQGIYRLTPGPVVLATWYSGILRMRLKNERAAIDNGIQVENRKERCASFDNGKLIRIWEEVDC